MRRICRKPFLFCFVVLLLTVLVPQQAYCSNEPWYEDLDYHWARFYILVLHRERVTDGWIYYRTSNPVTYYRPDWECTRSQLAVLLCKVFGLPEARPVSPSYPDVPKGYAFLQSKPGWAWIEGALSGGIAFVPAGSPFLPDAPISRQDAVELLIRALDLYEYAHCLSDKEVSSLLGLFRDSHKVAADRRHSMACAIKLGIIDGYEDDTIRPEAPMMRAEAATVVYRSCLIRVDADISTFSPDGDGIDETVNFTLTHLKNRNVTQWQMVIQDLSGKVVYSFNTYGADGAPPKTVSWDGNNGLGSPVPAGQYSYQAWVRDSQGNQFFSIKKPLTLIRHSLSASRSPSQVRDGDRLSITANTTPAPVTVTAQFADGDLREMQPNQDNTRWSIGKIIGPSLPSGSQTVLVRAVFPGAIRERSLSFTKVKELWINPSVNPNPAVGGQSVNLECGTSSGVSHVTASLFGQEHVLVWDSSSATWRGATKVPLMTPEGDYPVLFTGIDGSDVVRQTVLLNVGTSAAATVRYVLTK